MNIININVDNSVFDKNSNHFKRLVDYSYLADSLTIIVPYGKKEILNYSDRLLIFGTGGRCKFFRFFNLYILAKKIISKREYDIISVQDQYYLALVGRILAKKFKIGLELQIHGFEKYSGLRKIIADFAIPRASAIRCVSQRLKRQLVRDFGVREEKITVAPIYSESVKFVKSKVYKVGNKDNNFIFLTVGRLVAIKNISLQIRAMAKLVESEKSKVESKKIELWIVGDGPEKSNLKYQISKLKLENNVKLLGWQNNPEEFYSQADAFLLTSNYEGWGMVAVEAANYGLPVIMTDVGCAGELIENEKSGLIVPVNNQVELEEAMVRIINNDSLRKKLAEGAFSAIKKLPSKEETLALYKQSWEKAMKNKPNR